MKIVVPKPNRGYYFERLFAVEMNDFDSERLLPSLIYLIVTRGRQRGRRVNDPKAFQSCVESLAGHKDIVGFDIPTGKRLLARWLRTSVVRMGKAGASRREEQMDYIRPLSLLCYKPGFPAEIRRQRNVHLFFYTAMIRTLEGLYSKLDAQKLLDNTFTKALGKGVKLGGAPTYDGQYDGSDDIDLQCLLALRFLEGLQPSPAANRESLIDIGPALPAQAQSMALDILRFSLVFHGGMPTLAWISTVW